MYIFEISCLSVALFAIIFSHSEACLFTLLIVSFDVQKLLSLIRSHLFIFAFILGWVDPMVNDLLPVYAPFLVSSSSYASRLLDTYASVGLLQDSDYQHIV